MTKQFFNSQEKVAVEGYPYGRLRTTAYFSLEFKRGKGFRSVFQTINPKNGRLNAEKKSTYSTAMLMYKESETGHVKYEWLGFNGKEEMKRSIPILAETHQHFTAEQIEHIYSDLLVYMRADMIAGAKYKGKDIEELKPLYKPCVDLIVQGMTSKGEKPLFAEIAQSIDWAAIDAVKVPENYQPFKVTSYALGG